MEYLQSKLEHQVSVTGNSHTRIIERFVISVVLLHVGGRLKNIFFSAEKLPVENNIILQKMFKTFKDQEKHFTQKSIEMHLHM